MTTKDLKEVALQAGGIFGVSGMKKEQLVDALRKAKDIEAVPMKKTDASTRQIKAQIRAIRAQRMEATAANNRKQATILRRRIARLKKKTRHASA
jgi:hypothetical protein